MLVKIDEYIGFCVHRRSYLLGSPVIDRYHYFLTSLVIRDTYCQIQQAR